MKESVKERFWNQVKKTDACWIWGNIKRGHYGIIKINGKNRGAHRFSYELYFGKIEDGLQLDHLCRNPSCVNPYHLEPVTRRINILRGESVVAKNAKKQRCVKGHLFNEKNTYRRPDGYRACKVCQRQLVIEYRTRLKNG